MGITFLGGGNMASALASGLMEKGMPRISLRVVEPVKQQREFLANRYGINAIDHWPVGKIVGRDDVIVLAVKPQQMQTAVLPVAQTLSELKPDDRPLVLSVAAGIRTTTLSAWLGGHTRVVRTMPNTPSMIGLGAIGLAAGESIDERDRELAQSIMQTVGETVWVTDESMLDAVTALSGGGPAYVFRMIEAMSRAGEALGLTPQQAQRLTLYTFAGSAQLALRADEDPAVLRERVTSKGGTTAAALAVMNRFDIDRMMTEALQAARTRSEELGREFGDGASGSWGLGSVRSTN